MQLKANYHTHTVFCDGQNTAEEMVREAIRKGFRHLGFSGHVDIDPKMEVGVYQQEIRRLAAHYEGQIEILCGGELDSLYPDRQPAGFDYLIGSVHHMAGPEGEPLAVDWDVKMERLLRDGYGGDGYRLCRDYYRQIAEAYGNGGVAWIGHLDLVTCFNETMGFVDEEDGRYLGPAREAIDLFAEKGIPLEINTKQWRRGKIYPSETLLRHLRERGGEIVISSDAHRAEDLDQGFEEAILRARECGFGHTNILTREQGKVCFREVAIQ